ncbi:MAG: M20/M25/M40 family metallo-hydrolase [Mucilaginibacter sp.]|nr:M20/M25/M40 family metallo-hydrolase [Mucilaginibacter sp.]
MPEDILLLLKSIIAVPSMSGSEDQSAKLIEHWMHDRSIKTYTCFNNVWAFNKHYDPTKATILLTAHHDTVMPCSGYTRDPFFPEETDGKIYGLGSCDAAGALVALLAVFQHYYEKPDLPFNLCFGASAEEEISGGKGLSAVLPLLGKIDLGIIGAPTNMNVGTAEMGHLVIDCTCYGTAGHSAASGGTNAVYQALKDIQWFSTYRFPVTPAFMYPVKMTVTKIHGGVQDNSIPDECGFTVDIRLNTCYEAAEVLKMIDAHTTCQIKVRPGIASPSSISPIHPIVLAGVSLGLKTKILESTSDRFLLTCPAIILGPGDISRAHAADEYILIDEIRHSVSIYIQLLERLTTSLVNNIMH